MPLAHTSEHNDEGRRMMVINMRPVLLAAILATVFSAADRVDAAGFSQQALRAKIEYCKTCHGISAQGYHGFYPIPRLAGQQPQYIENQLRAFIDRRRKNSYMYSVAHVLSPSMRTALAKHFSALNSKPLGGGSRALVAAGKKIYEEGDPNSNVPACMACHGGEAKGQAEIPRLAGQLPDYIFNKLVDWNKERGQDPKHPDISAIMLPTSHNLTKAQIRAVAAYVNHLQ
jgi:cytochrome c553